MLLMMKDAVEQITGGIVFTFSSIVGEDRMRSLEFVRPVLEFTD